MLLACSVAACVPEQAGPELRDAQPRSAAAPPKAAQKEDPYREFPLYGLVTGAVLLVRKSADASGPLLGWLRRGEIVRLKPSSETTATCSSGWHPIHPEGFACAGEGVRISGGPPERAPDERGADRSAPLPYDYYLVKDAKAPELHAFPSREQVRAVQLYTDAWLTLLRDATPDAGVSARELKKREKSLKKFEAGELPDQPKKPPIIRRFLERGFFVAGTGVIERPERRFVHAVRGSYVSEAQLAEKGGAQFRGVELDAATTLPVAWAVRPAVPQRAVSLPDGTTKLVDAEGKAPLERLSLVPSRKGWARVNDKPVHELSDGTLLREWYLAVAERIARPREVRPDEPWIHVDVGEQTLVLYVGDEPRYATLVSSGTEDHPTPLGSYRITRKFVSDSMSDIGADAADDRYSIDDVPWAQYFHGARALHAAFWHTGFGLPRSHGCINLAPADAFYIFQRTWPELPPAWHGVSAQNTGWKGSLVLITE
jgi:L,D-transpeptidase catalytic domain